MVKDIYGNSSINKKINTDPYPNRYYAPFNKYENIPEWIKCPLDIDKKTLNEFYKIEIIKNTYCNCILCENTQKYFNIDCIPSYNNPPPPPQIRYQKF